MRRQSGRIHILTILGIVCALLVVGLLFFSKESPENVASSYMSALARGDAAALTELSYYENDRNDLRKQYDFATQVAAKYYRFVWKIDHSKQTGKDSAAVVLKMVRNSADASAYEENFELPMVMQDGKWKVDVASIQSGMYPALPR
jgi:hypothetical protein